MTIQPLSMKGGLMRPVISKAYRLCMGPSSRPKVSSLSIVHPYTHHKSGRIRRIASLQLRPFASVPVADRDKKEKEGAASQNSIAGHGKKTSDTSTDQAPNNSLSRQDTLANFYRLVDFAKPEHTLILKSAATLLVTSSSTLVLPAVSGHVLDLILSGDPNSGSPALLAAGLFGLTAAAGAGVYARTLWLQKAGNQITARLKEKLFGSILRQEMAFLESQKTGDLVTRLSQDTVLIQQAVTTQSVSVLRAVVMSTGSTVMLFSTSATLAALSLATLPPLFMSARYVGQQLREQQKKVQSLHGKSTTAAEETLSGMSTVVQFGAERQELSRYCKFVNEAHDAAIATGRMQALFDGSVHVAANGAILCVLGYGGNMVTFCGGFGSIVVWSKRKGSDIYSVCCSFSSYIL